MLLDKIKVLYDQQTIRNRIQTTADFISQDYARAKEPIVLLCVLKGSVNFFSDLSLSLDMDVQYEFVGVSSYDGTESNRKPSLTLDLPNDLQNKHVIIVEDIVDTGHTVKFLKDLINMQSPASLKVCTLLSKQPCREVAVTPDYVVFEIDDIFVVGYGLDVDQKYRNLPCIGKYID